MAERGFTGETEGSRKWPRSQVCISPALSFSAAFQGSDNFKFKSGFTTSLDGIE